MKKLLSLVLALTLIVTCLSGVVFAADPIARVETGGRAVEVTSVPQLQAAINANGTSVVTLLADVTYTDQIKIPVCTFDLNGHTWSTKDAQKNALYFDGRELTAENAANFKAVVKNGTIDAGRTAISSNVGALRVQNVTMSCHADIPAIQLLSGSNNSLHQGEWNDGNVMEDCTVYCFDGPAFRYNTDGSDFSRVKYTIKNSTMVTESETNPVLMCRGGVSEAGGFEIGEGVSFYYKVAAPIQTGEKAPVITGKKIEKAEGTHSVTVAGVTYEGLSKSAATGEDAVAPVIPETPSVPTAPAPGVEKPANTDNTPEEVAIMQQAVVEMANAYLLRKEDTRYEFESLVILDRYTNGVGRISTDTHLGAAAPDDHFITNCAQFTYNVYYNCFGVGPNGGNSRTSHTSALNDSMTMEHPEMILRYGKDGLTDKQEFYDQMLKVLQPGDLLYMRMKNGQNHAMIYVGDIKGTGKGYIIHSTGDSREIMGDTNKTTVRIDSIDYLARDTSYGVFNPDAIYYFVLRPINNIDFSQLTSDALARLQYPGATFVRTADVWKYMDVQEGQEISVKTSLRNDGKADFTDIVISDPAPVGVEILPDTISEGGVLKDGGVEWKLRLAPGKSVDLTYKVKVTAKAGEKVVLTENTVGGIRGREISWYVGGEPVSAEPLKALISNPVVEGLETGANRKELDMANIVYEKVLGVELGLPSTMQELMDGILDVNGFKMLEPKSRDDMTPEFQRIYDMIIPDHLGGQVVLLGIDPVSQFPHNRVHTYFPQAYRPGDIFLIFDGDETAYQCKFYKYCSVAIYLGEGKVLMADQGGGGLVVKNFEETITQTMFANVMITLRPSCTFPDPLTHLHAAEETPAEPETPETPAEPGTSTEPEAPAGPETPEAPETEGGFPVALVVGTAAAVVIAAAVLTVLKKKKK